MIFNKSAKALAFESAAKSDEVQSRDASTHTFHADSIRPDVPLTLLPQPLPHSDLREISEERGTPVEEASLRALQAVEKSGDDIGAMREEIGHLSRVVQKLSAQHSVQQNVFDTLHTELADYKNDFVGARMKPVITNLLFLYDTIEMFQKEVGGLVDPPDWLGDKVLSKKLVGANLEHFNDQLSEAMLLCEMNAIEVEVGEMADAKTQKFIGTKLTDDAALDGHIQKVVRRGWKQGSRVFRPTEVIVWNFKP